MHLLRADSVSLDEAAAAVDLGQSAADFLFLSFTDSDLAAMAAAWERGEEHSEDRWPSLRLANLASLRHPYSVDLYLEKTAAHARFVLVRLLGGMDYWRYGVEELAALARARGFTLAIVPGDYQADERLDAASTAPTADLRRLWRYFQEGGPHNMAACLAYMARGETAEPACVEAFGHSLAPEGGGACARPRALIVHYRSIHLVGDTAPIEALAAALRQRGAQVSAVYVTSLKDPAAAGPLAEWLRRYAPDVILNATAFSARSDDGAGVLDAADAPVLQAALAGSTVEQWRAASRGLRAADLAMNVALPEIDGRLLAGAVSFKGESPGRPRLEFSRQIHAPEPDGVAHAADLALAWARLRRTPRAERRLACLLSDYPGKGGRAGYAVGLDTFASVAAIAGRLRTEGFATTSAEAADIVAALTQGPSQPLIALADYAARFEAMPAAFAASVRAAWGEPAQDPDFAGGWLRARILRSGRMVVALQPERGRAKDRRETYHDGALAPRHAYVAFYLWLREIERVHALIHCGAHGTLEWLPGKALVLSRDCAPRAVLGALPVVYPFIVNNPGEAAQAKRRLGAVTLGHMTPPLVAAGAYGATAELEAMFDEYAQAQALDPARARHVAAAILALARDSGALADAGDGDDPLAALDAWLCDVKEMRIGDGLHVYGAGAPSSGDGLLGLCPEAEMSGLLRALDGRFVPPGPAGAPAQGRLDVLPTGRNLYAVDPRGVPTRAAWEMGAASAREICQRYAQDHGEWPRRVVLDLWASAAMRTGGHDLAQAFALIGARPTLDAATGRVSGFEILPLARLERARVDATLRVSGLFRDVFPEQMALFDQAVRAVAALDEDPADNPLAAARTAELPRIFSAAPGEYGIGLSRRIAGGEFTDQAALGESYLAATTHAYGLGEGQPAAGAFRAQVQAADVFAHVQDMAGQDILDSDAFAEHEGGFAAAAAALGATPAVYHVDATRPDSPKARTLPEEIARVMRGRAANPRWIAGQMRHHHRGGAEIAETVDNLFAYAALTQAVESRHFDLMFDAVCGEETVRRFLIEANPDAARAIAERFAQAIARGLWATRRNSTQAILDEMRGDS